MQSGTAQLAENTVRQTITRYAGSNLVRQILGMLTAFARSRLLSPEQFGLWSLLNLIPQYSGFLHLGSRSGITYRIPQLQQKQDAAGAALVRNTVRRFSLATSLLAALALLAAAAILHQDRQLSLLLVLSAVLVLVNWWFEHRVVLLKGQQCFDLISRSNYLRAILLLVSTLVLLPFWGVAGAVLAVVLTLTVSAIYLLLHSPRMPHAGFDPALLRRMIRQGAPLLGVSLAVLLLRNIDRLMIAGMLDLHAVGLYALGGMIVGFLINIPGVSREVLEPRLMQAQQKRPLDRLVGPYLIEPVFKSALLMPLVVVPAELILPFFIHGFLPEYSEGIDAIRILLLSSLLIALFYPLRGIVVARDWQGRTLLHALVAVGLNAVGNWHVLRQGWGLEAVAWVSLASFATLLVFEWFTVMGRIPHPREMIPGRRSLLWLLALTISLALPWSTVVALSPPGGDSDLQRLMMLPGFLLLYLPAAFYLFHEPRRTRSAQDGSA